jgi:hypothetical protein
MPMTRTTLALIALLGLLVTASGAVAQTRPAWGRVALFGNGATTTRDEGPTSTLGELIANITFESATGDDVRFDYRADIRLAGYAGEGDRDPRVSLYDAYAGVRLRGGTIGIRGGQMWLTDLGGLGSVGGGMVEFAQRRRPGGSRWRAALFGGLEPRIMEAGYVDHVTKFGGLVAYDGAGMRRHVVGFVHIRDEGVTERSVLSFTNFLPLGKQVFVYQAAEYDVDGPGIPDTGALTYFFANGRYVVNRWIELQGLYHHGRSIDSRSIVRDQLDGRPIDPKALDGLRFESITGRATVSVGRYLRLFGGYGQDRNNREDEASGRLTYGAYASNVLRTGIDVTFSDSRIDRGANGWYDSWYVSVGRSFGSRVYLTGDYSSSLSFYKFTSAAGFTIESQPTTRRLALSSVINTTRTTSVLITGERVLFDDGAQTRFLAGLTWRF